MEIYQYIIYDIQHKSQQPKAKYALWADEGNFEPERQPMNMSRLLHVKRQRYNDILQVWLGGARKIDGVLLGLWHAHSRVERVLHISAAKADLYTRLFVF